MEQQEKVTSSHSEDEIEQIIAHIKIAVEQSCGILTNEINKEKQKISMLEREREIIRSEAESLREVTSKCEEDTSGALNGQCVRNGEINDNHKKNKELLDQHISEVEETLNIEKQKESDAKQFFDKKTAKYELKWQEYFEMYSKHPLFPQYEEQKRQHIELQEYLKSAESQLRQLQADVFRIKCERSRKNSKESKFYPMQNVVVWIAQLSHDTTQAEKDIKKTFNDCSDLKAKLSRFKSKNQKRKCLVDSGKKDVSALHPHGDNNEVRNDDERTNRARQISLMFPTLVPTYQPKTTSSLPKLELFIPKFSSIPSGFPSLSSSHKPNEKVGISIERSLLNEPAKNMMSAAETFTHVETSESSVSKPSSHIPSHNKNILVNSLKGEASGGASLSEVRSYATGYGQKFKTSASFTSQPTPTVGFGRMPYTQSASSSSSDEIKKETKLSPYFMSMPKPPVDTQTTHLIHKTYSPQCGDKTWDDAANTSPYAANAPPYTVNTPPYVANTSPYAAGATSTNRETVNSRSFSPFDINKHTEALKEMKKSPDFDYKSRSMYAVGGSVNDNVIVTGGKHQITDSEMFCSSLLVAAGAAAQNQEQRLSGHNTPPRSHREEIFSVEKLCDSSKAVAGTEKSLFDFDKIPGNQATRSSVFRLFGDDDTEADAATATTSSFSFDFGPPKEKTETSSFKFLF